MSDAESLSERERRVLEAVIETYIATAEPAGSQTVARRSALGISPASIRTAMVELEAKGFLFHPRHQCADLCCSDVNSYDNVFHSSSSSYCPRR